MTLNVKDSGEKRKYNPRLSTDTVLWWLQPTTEMGLASGFETYLTAYCSHQKIKERKNWKHKNKNDASLCRGARGWDRSMGNLHFTSPRDVKINKHWVESTKFSTSWDRLIWADCSRFESSVGTQIIMCFLSLSYKCYHLFSVIQLVPWEWYGFYWNALLELKNKECI